MLTKGMEVVCNEAIGIEATGGPVFGDTYMIEDVKALGGNGLALVKLAGVPDYWLGSRFVQVKAKSVIGRVLSMFSALRVVEKSNGLSWETFTVGHTVQTSRGPATVRGIQISYVLTADVQKMEGKLNRRGKVAKPQHYTEPLSMLPKQH